MTRREIIVEMLRRYNDAEDPCQSGTGLRGTGDRVPLMPAEWNRSFRELERVLKLMRSEAPWLWWDLRERFLSCQIRTVDATVKNGVLRLPDCCELAAGAVDIGARSVRVRVVSWSPLVRPERVEKGVDWVVSRFQGDPFLPLEMTEMEASDV